jgi:hypothetical protein
MKTTSWVYGPWTFLKSTKSHHQVVNVVLIRNETYLIRI